MVITEKTLYDIYLDDVNVEPGREGLPGVRGGEPD